MNLRETSYEALDSARHELWKSAVKTFKDQLGEFGNCFMGVDQNGRLVFDITHVDPSAFMDDGVITSHARLFHENVFNLIDSIPPEFQAET